MTVEEKNLKYPINFFEKIVSKPLKTKVFTFEGSDMFGCAPLSMPMIWYADVNFVIMWQNEKRERAKTAYVKKSKKKIG